MQIARVRPVHSALLTLAPFLKKGLVSWSSDTIAPQPQSEGKGSFSSKQR